MAFSRYAQDGRINAGTSLSTAQTVGVIRAAVGRGDVSIVRRMKTSGLNRLDNLAGDIYGDARYWWILAAGSDIGWGLQVPPGTIINVLDMSDVQRLVG